MHKCESAIHKDSFLNESAVQTNQLNQWLAATYWLFLVTFSNNSLQQCSPNLSCPDYETKYSQAAYCNYVSTLIQKRCFYTQCEAHLFSWISISDRSHWAVITSKRHLHSHYPLTQMIILRLGPVTTLIIIWVCLCSFVPLFNTDSLQISIYICSVYRLRFDLFIYILWPLKRANVQQVHARSKKKTMTGRINVIFCFMHVNSLYGRGYEHGCSTQVLLPVFFIHPNNDYQWTCITNHSLKIRLMSIIDGWSLLSF